MHCLLKCFICLSSHLMKFVYPGVTEKQVCDQSISGVHILRFLSIQSWKFESVPLGAGDTFRHKSNLHCWTTHTSICRVLYSHFGDWNFNLLKERKEKKWDIGVWNSAQHYVPSVTVCETSLCLNKPSQNRVPKQTK